MTRESKVPLIKKCTVQNDFRLTVVKYIFKSGSHSPFSFNVFRNFLTHFHRLRDLNFKS